jgi:hypothetical protein
MVKELLGVSKFLTATVKELTATVKEAIAAAKAISASSGKRMVVLRKLQEHYYGKKGVRQVLSVGETRWNSSQGCFASQLLVLFINVRSVVSSYIH